VDTLTRAIEMNPDDAKAYYNRGIAYKRLGNDEKASADKKKAIKLDPKTAIEWLMKEGAE